MPAPAPSSCATRPPVATSAPSTETLMVPSAVVSASMLPSAHAGSCSRGGAGPDFKLEWVRGCAVPGGRGLERVAQEGPGRSSGGGWPREGAAHPDGLERGTRVRPYNLGYEEPGRLRNGAPPGGLNLDARVRPRVKGRQNLARPDRALGGRAPELRPQEPGRRGGASETPPEVIGNRVMVPTPRDLRDAGRRAAAGAHRSGAKRQSHAAASWSRRGGLSLMSVGSVAAESVHTRRPLSAGTTRTAGGTLGARRAAATSRTGSTGSSARASASASSANVYELHRLALAAISRSVATRLAGATPGSPHPVDCGWPSTPIVATHSACAGDKTQQNPGGDGPTTREGQRPVSAGTAPKCVHSTGAVLPRKRPREWPPARCRRWFAAAAPGVRPSLERRVPNPEGPAGTAHRQCI